MSRSSCVADHDLGSAVVVINFEFAALYVGGGFEKSIAEIVAIMADSLSL